MAKNLQAIVPIGPTLTRVTWSQDAEEVAMNLLQQGNKTMP